MVSEHPILMDREANIEAENRSGSNKRNTVKVPKKIHKAEREKLKRDHLNELFLELGHALEPTRQNNGKASILGDATRLLRELLSQIEGLKKENAALVNESHYVTVEKNELKDETVVLGAEIEKLQNELRERMLSGHAWGNGMDASSSQLQHHPNSVSFLHEDQHRVSAMDPAMQAAAPVVRPLFVIPFHGGEVQALSEIDAAAAAQVPCKPSSHVRRPHARYPTPSDSWPSQLLLSRQQPSSKDKEAQLIRCGSSPNPNPSEEKDSGNVEACGNE